MGLTMYGQTELEVVDISKENEVFAGYDTQAGVFVICPGNITLQFESTHDLDIKSETTKKGEEVEYKLVFETGKKYKGRVLTIYPSDHSSITIALELSPKEAKRYRLKDPFQAWTEGAYIEFRKRGLEYFSKSMYSEAKENYINAKTSSDCPKDSNIDELIANVDSVLVLLQEAHAAEDLLDYNTAIKKYGRLSTLNPLDNTVEIKKYELERKVQSDCNRYFTEANNFLKNSEYDKARELFQRVVDMNCINSITALEMIKDIDKHFAYKKQRARVFLVEMPLATSFANNTNYADYKSAFNIGLTYGTFKKNRAGGYFSINFSPLFFDAIQGIKENEMETRAVAKSLVEANMSAGWTVNPIPAQKVAWLYFTIFGYTTGGYYNCVADKTLSDEEKKPSFYLAHAWTPEAGIVLKLGPVSLNYKFQYRYAILPKDNTKCIFRGDIDNGFKSRAIRHEVGIGFNW